MEDWMEDLIIQSIRYLISKGSTPEEALKRYVKLTSEEKEKILKKIK